MPPKRKITIWIAVFVALTITALQIAGPFLFGFANWCNVIQYVSGYEDIGTACVVVHFLIDYYTSHKKRLREIEEHLFHLRNERDG